jgi:hypothetical protein
MKAKNLLFILLAILMTTISVSSKADCTSINLGIIASYKVTDPLGNDHTSYHIYYKVDSDCGPWTSGWIDLNVTLTYLDIGVTKSLQNLYLDVPIPDDGV